MVIALKFVREKAFDSKIKTISRTYRRMDELDRAIEWGLSHNPKQFYNICDEFYLWKTDKLIDEIPQLRILYKYIEAARTVYLIAVDEVKD
jgi:hypothetical protein